MFASLLAPRTTIYHAATLFGATIPRTRLGNEQRGECIGSFRRKLGDVAEEPEVDFSLLLSSRAHWTAQEFRDFVKRIRDFVRRILGIDDHERTGRSELARLVR